MTETVNFQFPKDFLWGASTAAHQVEGNNINSESWVLEHLPGTIYAEPSGDAAEGGESKSAEFQRELNDNYLEQLHGDDFVGVQTYSHMVVGPNGIVKPGDDVKKNQMGEEYYPEAIGGTIRHAAEVARIPIFVTENGLSTTDDSRRLEYFQRALRSVASAFEDSIDVRGYFCWSAMDNFEWVSGYGPKFGIIEVDRATQKRTPKPSAYWLGNVARKNRLQYPK